ncbi:Enolase-like protein ENO4 [Intoshia linei]|uniref:Enolase-like protein ENO4 n=1 Tax=Intoshia linei TaxID=1819745 RepID=A0A177AV42_9BILA|nr:Enolase-like protein ENO4 [Intoshia linei]
MQNIDLAGYKPIFSFSYYEKYCWPNYFNVLSNITCDDIKRPYQKILSKSNSYENNNDIVKKRIQAINYFKNSKNLLENINYCLNALVKSRPIDMYGFMGNYFSSYSTEPTIHNIETKQGFITIEKKALQIDIILNYKNKIFSMGPRYIICENFGESQSIEKNNNSIEKCIEYFNITNYFVKIIGKSLYSYNDIQNHIEILYKTVVENHFKMLESISETDKDETTDKPDKGNSSASHKTRKKTKQIEDEIQRLEIYPESFEKIPGTEILSVSIEMLYLSCKMLKKKFYHHLIEIYPRNDNFYETKLCILVCQSQNKIVGKIKCIKSMFLYMDYFDKNQMISCYQKIFKNIQEFYIGKNLNANAILTTLPIQFDKIEIILDIISDNLKSLEMENKIKVAINCGAYNFYDSDNTSWNNLYEKSKELSNSINIFESNNIKYGKKWILNNYSKITENCSMDGFIIDISPPLNFRDLHALKNKLNEKTSLSIMLRENDYYPEYDIDVSYMLNCKFVMIGSLNDYYQMKKLERYSEILNLHSSSDMTEKLECNDTTEDSTTGIPTDHNVNKDENNPLDSENLISEAI